MAAGIQHLNPAAEGRCYPRSTAHSMLRKLTLAFGVLFLVMLVLLGRTLMLAEHPALDDHRRFFLAVESGDADMVLDLLDTDARERIDEPALAAWLEAVGRELGAFREVRRTDFSGRRWTEGEATRVSSRGTALFDRGTIVASLEYRDDRIVDLQVESDQAQVEWLKASAP